MKSRRAENRRASSYAPSPGRGFRDARRRTTRKIPIPRRTAGTSDSSGIRSEKANADLRRTLDRVAPRGNHRPHAYRRGLSHFKLITREPAGQRELSDPKVQQTIRETDQSQGSAVKAAYYEMARNDAKVVNYFVNGIINTREKK